MKYSYDFNLISPEIISETTENKYQQKYIIGPLENGFAITLGNALRRIALSSLPGGAVKKIQIKGVSNEFDVLDTIVEDVTSIVLAVKELNLKIDKQDEDFVLILEKNKKGEILAKDIKCPAGVEIINKDLKIATLVKDEPFYMELTASKGIGYILAEENAGKDKQPNVIYIDSIYTPVKKFSYTREDRLHGDKTNYDNLIIEITTNGTITPNEALSYSAHIMKEHMNLIENLEDILDSKVFEENVEVEEVIVDEEIKEETPIETLDISNRAYNGLKKAGINSLEQLAQKSKKEIASVENIGAKTVDEIQAQLVELGYDLN